MLLTDHSRICLANVGVVDVLEADTRKKSAEHEDIIALGNLILALATKAISDSAFQSHEPDLLATSNYAHRLRYVASLYSRELHAVILELIIHPPTIFSLCDMLSGRAFDELDTTYRNLDACQVLVSAEIGAGRVLRVLLHLSSALSGSENLGTVWSEAGERYLLVLFLDYMFNQSDNMGQPIINYGHVVACLMKVDASDTENLLLVSHDERTILVTSYLEIHEALNFLSLRVLHSDNAYFS